MDEYSFSSFDEFESTELPVQADVPPVSPSASSSIPSASSGDDAVVVATDGQAGPTDEPLGHESYVDDTFDPKPATDDPGLGYSDDGFEASRESPSRDRPSDEPPLHADDVGYSNDAFESSVESPWREGDNYEAPDAPGSEAPLGVDDEDTQPQQVEDGGADDRGLVTHDDDTHRMQWDCGDKDDTSVDAKDDYEIHLKDKCPDEVPRLQTLRDEAALDDASAVRPATSDTSEMSPPPPMPPRAPMDAGIDAFYYDVCRSSMCCCGGTNAAPVTRTVDDASGLLIELVLSLLREQCRSILQEPIAGALPARVSVPTQTTRLHPDTATVDLINTKYIAFMQHLSQRGRALQAKGLGAREDIVERHLHETMCQLFANPKMILVVRDIMLQKLQEHA
ncbi:hypothetical protein SDRG_00655 [Saprolegnia diclina VS20]|uniref:Uncharacterized protein n=1 Tax=Saprolegnia diclina (strain VS20) TaxID=1156394 RepID=T0SFL9_SAPDV|nr:hypothetical protein SDRG_00655 [Saprolegnia diclina VS20]EQC41792.1 hypothetical protein SDRG_00655 [Saprolegnia diclina VS20]|eukprot:XP_008604361.1 hypothetical protein SDRG_00655 [Saprolegnia diclina VS20]